MRKKTRESCLVHLQERKGPQIGKGIWGWGKRRNDFYKNKTHKKNQKIGSSQKSQNLFMEKENCTTERKRISSFVKMGVKIIWK